MQQDSLYFSTNIYIYDSTTTQSEATEEQLLQTECCGTEYAWVILKQGVIKAQTVNHMYTWYIDR